MFKAGQSQSTASSSQLPPPPTNPETSAKKSSSSKPTVKAKSNLEIESRPRTPTRGTGEEASLDGAPSTTSATRRALRPVPQDLRNLPPEVKTVDRTNGAELSDAEVSALLDEVAPLLRNLSQNPQAPMTPSAQQALANVAAAIFSNMVGFGIPTLVSAGVPKEWQGLAYGATLAATSLVTPDATSAITRKLGGANASLLVGGDKSAISGPYKKIGGDTLSLAANLAVYGGMNIGESAKLHTSWDTVAKSASSGVGMAVLMQGLLYLGAKLTLSRQGVDDAKKLPELDHNRTLKSGVYLRQVPQWSDRTNLSVKTQELLASAIATTLGSAAAGTIKHFAPTESGPLQSFVTIVGGIGAYFAAAAVGRLVNTKFIDHPGKFANRAAIAASDVAVQHIAKSAMNEFESTLDNLGDEIQKGKWGADNKTHYDNAFDTFLGKAFRTPEGEAAPAKADLDKARAFSNQLDGIIRGLDHTDSTPANTVPDATVARMKTMIGAASESIKVATRSAEEGGPINFAMQDVRSRLRDVQSLLLQSQYQAGGPLGMQTDTRVMGVALELAPAFAALRQFDRMSGANKFVDQIIQHSNGKATAADVTASFDGTGRRHLLVMDVMLRLSGRMDAVPKDAPLLRAGVNTVVNETVIGTQPSRGGAKMLILSNMLSDTGRAGQPPNDADQAAARAFFRTLETRAGVITPQISRDAFMNQFKTGTPTAAALQQELRRVADLAPAAEMPGAFPGGGHELDHLEAGRPSPAYQQAVAQFREEIGADFVNALAEEPSLLPANASEMRNADSTKEPVKDMITAMWRDAESMPKVHHDLMAAAMSINIRTPALPAYLTHDAHFHPTSYSGRVNSLAHLIDYMDAAGTERTNLAGIPSQQRNPRPDRKYYANSEEDIYYRDHDKPLMDQYRELTDEQKKRFDLSMTGFDVTDGKTIGDEMDSRLRTAPGAYAAVGEVTWKKEIVSGKNPREPNLESVDTLQLLEGAAQRGLPVILHCDRGTPEDKNVYAQQVIKNIRSAVSTLRWEQNDILAQKGIQDAPKVTPKFVWAHGAGISRFTAESVDHTRNLDALLSEADLKDVLSLDLSWDFIGHDIMENLHDSLTRRGIAPELCNGLQNLLRTYKAFTEEGGRADKCDDMGDLNLASVHRVAAENIRQSYLLALQDFKVRVNTALDDAPTRQALFEMANNHGDQGNNWLHVFHKHQDRLLFGTDALAPGIKAHGDAAYAMNVRVLNPLYMLFDGLGARVPAGTEDTYSTITNKVTRENYEGVFANPEVEARRASYENYLAKEKSADHSTNRVSDSTAFTINEVRPDNLRYRGNAARTGAAADA